MEAEKALLTEVDVAPLVDKQSVIYGNGVDHRIDAAGIVVQSVRILA